MKNKMYKPAAISAAAVLSLSLLLTACGDKNNSDNNPDIVTSATTAPQQAVIDDPFGTDDSVSVYTGREVENESDLAIFKISFDLPDGWETTIDNADGKQFLSEKGEVVVKAQNFKEEFQDLAVFADQGCAGIKMNNMLFQADTEFSDPINTTVAGFDAIRYDYTVTAYEFEFELDEEGAQIINENGERIVKSKNVIGVFSDRVYYFYSDEDVFYIICEASKENAVSAAADFDSIISSAKIS
ncbi:MAG: hypothetical protein K2K57_00190 [Oscillospiraceae bacterium]|nr:hypothetical protein [Oscillospiraceae bacterium]